MNLQTAIQGRGLKQGWVATQLDIRKDSFSRMVRGETRFPVEKIERLSDLLGMSMTDTVRVLAEPFAETESKTAAD